MKKKSVSTVELKQIARDLQAEGNTYTKITKIMNALGYKTVRGAQISRTSVATYLKKDTPKPTKKVVAEVPPVRDWSLQINAIRLIAGMNFTADKKVTLINQMLA